MNKYNLKFKSISKIVVSPRSLKILYKGVDFREDDLVKPYSNLEKEESNKITVIYPFYNYKDKLDEMIEKPEYYLPGSSIKGSIFPKEEDIRCDDIKLGKEDIVLDLLYKVIDYDEEKCQKSEKDLKIPKYKNFFENLGVEMINFGKEFETDIISVKKKNILEMLKKVNEKTIDKLNRFANKIEKVIFCLKKIKEKEAINELNKLEKILNEIKKIIKKYSKEKDKMITFIGGFKGKVGTIYQMKEDTKTGLYFDSKTYLPYGLVEIKIS